MKPFKTLLTILFISLLSSPSWSAEMGDLVIREGIYYQKFTDVPFTGKVTGKEQGSFKNGNQEGAWVSYYESGELWHKGNLKNGGLEGAWVSYYKNGQLSYKGNYKNHKRVGEYIFYYENGQLQSKGNYKSGGREGAWVSYYEIGQLWNKGNYKNGKRDEVWVSYNKDGTVLKEWTGTFKDGVKVSD